jgi:hypothetical protein
VNPVAIALAILTSVSFPVTTPDAGAQALVDRGLFYYYAYDGGDAAETFAAAAARDPHLAMAYWGEALANGPDLNTPMTQERFALAQPAAQRASALEAVASARERALIDAMALRYRGTWADWARDDRDYRQAMAALAGASAGDNAAQLLAAEALLEHGTLAWDGPHMATAESRRAFALIGDVLARNPDDVMANHLCIHAYDAASDRAGALSCARRLDAATLAPQAEHLAHMPAHYWIETGNYAAAIASSERAYGLFVQLQQVADRDPDHDRYLVHDVYVGYSASMMLGNYATASRWAARMDAAFATSYDGLTALRFGRFADAYRLSTGSTVTDLAVRGYAALALGRDADAREPAARLRKLAAPGYLAELFLARAAECDGNLEEAGRLIDRAAGEQRDAYSNELIPLLPALEAGGNLALRRLRYADAADTYRAALAASPNDPRALFGLAAALRGQGSTQDANRVSARFGEIWQGEPAPSLDI